MGKKLVAARPLPAGHVLSREDIAIKSPGDGLPPTELDHVVGRRLLNPLSPDAAITMDVLAASPADVQV
jgi:N-acetylneuraminate synthase/sialic acid synthase